MSRTKRGLIALSYCSKRDDHRRAWIDKRQLVFIIVGYLIVFIAVFGSFVALGGHLGALYQPFEFTLIVGAALGAYLAARNGRSLRLMMRALRDAIKPRPYNKTIARELMRLRLTASRKARIARQSNKAEL